MYYQGLVDRLVAKKDYRGLPKLEAFVARVNCCRTLCTVSAPPPLEENRKAIHFNSKSKDFAFLSNFFPTLVLFPDHRDKDIPTIFPSAENAYQAHMACLALQREEETKEESRESEETGVDLLFTIAIADPLLAKQLARLHTCGSPRSDDSAKVRAQLIHDIAVKKLNAILCLANGSKTQSAYIS